MQRCGRFAAFLSRRSSVSCCSFHVPKRFFAEPEPERKLVVEKEDVFSVEGNKGFFRTLAEYSAFNTATNTIYVAGTMEFVNHFTILGPYGLAFPVIGAALYGFLFGAARGTVIGIGNSLIAQRKLVDIVSRAIKQVGADEVRLDDASEAELTALIEKVYARFPWTHRQTLGSVVKRSLAFAPEHRASYSRCSSRNPI